MAALLDERTTPIHYFPLRDFKKSDLHPMRPVYYTLATLLIVNMSQLLFTYYTIYLIPFAGEGLAMCPPPAEILWLFNSLLEWVLFMYLVFTNRS